LSFYVSIKTISVRNKNVQTTVSQRLAINVFWNTLPGRNNYVWVFTLTSRSYPYETKTLENTLSQRFAYNVFWIRYQDVKISLSFYVSIKTISVRNKNVQTTVSQRLAYSVFWNTSPGRNNNVWGFTLASRPYMYVTKTLENTLS
jgi:hypothetical protein